MVEVSLPVGPANLKADVPVPTPGKIRAWWRRRADPAPWVKVHLHHVEANIPGPEDGTVTFFMQVVNLFRRPVTIDHIVLEYWSWANHSLPNIDPSVNGIRSVIPRRSIEPLSMTVDLTAKAIRVIRDAAVKAPNVFSTPRGDLHVRASLYLLESRTPVGCEFHVPFPGLFIATPE